MHVSIGESYPFPFCSPSTCQGLVDVSLDTSAKIFYNEIFKAGTIKGHTAKYILQVRKMTVLNSFDISLQIVPNECRLLVIFASLLLLILVSLWLLFLLSLLFVYYYYHYHHHHNIIIIILLWWLLLLLSSCKNRESSNPLLFFIVWNVHILWNPSKWSVLTLIVFMRLSWPH